jgi:protein TonB
MKKIKERYIIRITFLFSLLFHFLLLGMHGFNLPQTVQLNKSQPVQIHLKRFRPVSPPPVKPKKEVKKAIKKIQKKKRPVPKPTVTPKKVIAKNDIQPPQPPQPSQTINPMPEDMFTDSAPLDTQDFAASGEIFSDQGEIAQITDEAMQQYQEMIKKKIESCKRYPRWAKKQGFQGVTHIMFTLFANGMIEDLKILHSSTYQTLDKEALSTVKRAMPFQPHPSGTHTSSIKMEIALVFELQ